MDQYLPPLLSSTLHHSFRFLEKLEPYVHKTLVVDTEEWTERYGYGKSYIFLGAMAACYPLGLVMHLLPYGDIRHWFSFISGALLLQICWGVHWIHTPLTCLIVYGMLRLFPRSKVQQAVPIYIMSYLAIAHFHHQYTVTDYLGMDIYFTCSQMILTQKLYMLAYNLHDGFLLARKGKDEDDDKDEGLKAARRCSEFALEECPTLIQFLGYSFCMTTVLVGPAFEFSNYLGACNGTLHYTIEKDGTRKLRGKVPSNILPTLTPFIQGFLMVLFASVFDRVCNYRRLTSSWYFNLAPRRRFFFQWVTNFVQRQKVYFTWLLAEGGNNIWHVGFDGYDKETGEAKGWNVARGADIWMVETCDSIKVGSRAWNKRTSLWLLRYVYIRNRSRLSILYMVSAFWHGFYPGYYLLATTIWFISQCERLGRKKISPYFSKKKWSFYGVTCMITIHALGSYCTSAFFLRSMENTMANWRSHYFWGHITCMLFYVVVSGLPTPPKQSTSSLANLGSVDSGKMDYTTKRQQSSMSAIETNKKEMEQQYHELERKDS